MRELIERLEKRAKEDELCAENSRVAFTLLKPELDRFNDRDGAYKEGRFNTYAVRMAVDHRNSMERDSRYASDLRAAIATLRALADREGGE